MRLNDLFTGLNYQPHVRQLSFHEGDARFKLLVAGSRFGKSLASARDVLIDLLSGPSRGWLVGPTYALTRPEFRYIQQDILTQMHGRVEQTDNPPALHTSWGAEVICMSAQRPETLLGEEIDWLILCEGAHLDREAFERFLRARLVSRNGRLLVPTTPRGHNWIFELYEQAIELNDWHVEHGATWDNPHVDPDEITSARASLTTQTFAEQFAGEFVTPHGRVYAEFNPALHVGVASPAPGSQVFKGIDFGYTNPFACIWGYIDDHGTLNILREYYRPESPMRQHSDFINSIDDGLRAAGCLVGPAFVDPSGPEQRRLLKEEGLHALPAQNHVEGGIEVVRQRLMVRDGHTGLRINPRCTNLLREIDSYMWDQIRRGQKGTDHALDALRYLCVSLSKRVDWKDTGFVW